MQAGAKRSVALDFFRGLAMLVIVVDHIGGSILSRFTLHSFAFPDAAEAFVFLSGYAIAGAWLGWHARKPEQASGKLLRRLWPIYRGFLICAALMLGCAALFSALGVEAPNLPIEALDDLVDSPASYILNLLLLRHQPYLASVLPMYLIFMLAAPAIVPLGLRRPKTALALSVLVWSLAQGAANFLPVSSDGAWEFNPFAWQCMFMIGVVGRSSLLQQVPSMPRTRRIVSIAALAIVLACAIWRIWIAPGYLDPALKQNLSIMRIVNFAAIAWLCACLGQTGWIGRIEKRVSWVLAVGRHSLPCFIAGSVISLVLDSILFQATNGRLDYPAGLLTDGVALFLMMGFALLLENRRTAKRAALAGVMTSS